MKGVGAVEIQIKREGGDGEGVQGWTEEGAGAVWRGGRWRAGKGRRRACEGRDCWCRDSCGHEGRMKRKMKGCDFIYDDIDG